MNKNPRKYKRYKSKRNQSKILPLTWHWNRFLKNKNKGLKNKKVHRSNIKRYSLAKL